MKKAGVFLLSVGLLLLLVSSCMIQIPIEEIPGTFVVESSSGSVVKDAEVVVKSGNVELDSGTTNESGEVTFNVDSFPEFIDVEVSKEGYALSKVEGLKVETIKDDSKNIILPELPEDFEGEYPDKFPITVEVELYDRNGFPLNTSNVRGKFIFDIFSHSEYGLKSNLVKLGEVPTEESNDWEFTGSWAITGYSIDVSNFSGETPFYVVVYDNMNNRIEKIVYLNIIQPNIKEGEFFVPINPAEFGDRPIRSYTYSETELKVHIDWITYEEALNMGVISSEDESKKPDGYKVYRSFDGKNYEDIARIDLEGSYYLVDSSNLEINKEVWYAVSSVKGEEESERVELGSVVPIDTFEVELVFPGDETQGVTLQPTFKWQPSKDLESSESDIHFEYRMVIMNEGSDEIIIPAYYYLAETTHYIFEAVGSQEVEVTFHGNEGSPEFNDLVWSVYTTDEQGELTYKGEYPTEQLSQGTSYKWAINYAIAYSYDFDSAAISTYVNVDSIEEIGELQFNTFTTGNE